jgi:hypothetical protein
VKRALSGLDIRIDAAHADFFETKVSSVAAMALRDTSILDCVEKNWVFRFDRAPFTRFQLACKSSRRARVAS